MTVAQTPSAPPRRECFSVLLDRIEALARANGHAPSISVRQVLAVVGRRAYGPLLLAVGLFSISPATIVPGMTWLSAAVVLVLALQMMIGARHPWLPRRTLDANVSPSLLLATARNARPWARGVDAVLKPRLLGLSEPPFVNLAGALVALMALATFPLGLIPVAPLAPGITIALIGLGLTARDGLVLLVAGLFVPATVFLAYVGVTLTF
jgi:hypothetical protein